MKKYFQLTTLILSFLLFNSCEKELDIKLNSENNKIVVQGQIATGELPYVTLTKSIGFFDKIDLNSIQYVKNAVVKVIDVNQLDTITLKEYSIDTVVDGKTFFFNIYGPDIADANAMNFKGQIEHSYQLIIENNGKIYRGITKIPAMTGLDSVWTEPVPGKETEFSALKAYYTDPDTFGNSVKVETLNNRFKKDTVPEIYYTPFQYVYDDAIINGVKLPLTLDLGYNKYQTYSNEEFQTIGFLRKGDTVTLKWGAIDRSVFKFWETLSFSENSVGNPFATPTKVQGNVSDALGVWAGYNNMYYTITDTIK